MPDSINGDLYVRNLAAFVRTNERSLASKHRPGKRNLDASVFSSPLNSLNIPITRSRAARLSLTPHHLFYLLHRFKDLGLPVGPLTVRLEFVDQSSSPSNYISFLDDSLHHKRSFSTDQTSIQSSSSVFSSISGVSAIFSNLSINSKEKARASLEHDLKYLYSSFTVLPSLRLAPDRKAKTIDGFEEFPFDRAVPLIAFKNLSSLELIDVDVRAFYGWDAVSERLKSLSVKHSQIDDPVDLIVGLVLDDINQRRKRSLDDIPAYTTVDADEGPENLLLARVVSSEIGSSGRRRSLSQSRSRRPNLTDDLQQRSRSQSTPRSARRLRSDSISSVASSLRSPSPPTELGPLNWHRLRILSLADNGISCITNEAMMPLTDSLLSLDLSSNFLVAIPAALSYLTSLTSLNISYNLISSLHSLAHHPLPAITVLNLRGNNIVSLAGLDRILSLERLDLRDNKLTDPTELARLTGAPNLSEIWVLGNPFVKSHHSSYRVTIFNLFRQTPGYTDDILLDGSLPGLLEQRTLAERAEEAVPSPVATRHGSNVIFDEQPQQPVKKEDSGDLLPKFSFNFFRSSPPPPPAAPAAAAAEKVKDDRDEMPPPLTAPRPIRTHPAMRIANSTTPTDKKPRKKAGRKRLVDLDPEMSGDDQLSTNTAASSVKSLGRSVSPPFAMTESEWTSKGEEYRKRIEALRNDFGSGWLSVLSEEL
ncbi:hypothetical protein BZA70DRAFT_278951 [Myxozyma melibiosi]|uniref:Uncharacterized protein n=1 Tax=Myxozyma melibiosi TaxID=54550 RepID=A0ABR1F5C5_9ASCO